MTGGGGHRAELSARDAWLPAAIVLASSLAGALPWAEAAAAQGFQDVSLSWVRTEGAERCIGAHALALAVQQRVGHPVWMASGDAQLSVEGYVSPSRPRGFDAVIVTANPEGEIVGRRELHTDSEDCQSLDEPLALVIALTIDPESGLVPLPDLIEDTADAEVADLLDTPVPAPDTDGGDPAAQGPRGSGEPADEGLKRPPRRDDGELVVRQRSRGPYAFASGGVGYTPGVTGSVGAGFMGSQKQMRAGAEARFWMPVHAKGYRFMGGQLALYGCPLWQRTENNRLEGQFCVGAAPGFTVASAPGRRTPLVSVDVEVSGRLMIRTERPITPYFGLNLGFVVYGENLLEGRGDQQATEIWTVPVGRGGVSFGLLYPL